MTLASMEPAAIASSQGTPSGRPLLKVENLRTYFPVKRGLLKRTVGHVKAVDGVSLMLNRGSTLGLVGESGCGKSTVGRSILRLIPATGGGVTFDGIDVLKADRKQMLLLRRRMQIVFQDPVGSLNPRMTVGRIIGEPILYHRLANKSDIADRVAQLLTRVGLSPQHAERYPHEFSGGQRQRIGIARALGLNPQFIVCDEPVSALDVSIQAQVLNLLADLQAELGLSYLFIAHNLAVVEHFCDRIAVMYLGRIVEVGFRREVVESPKHPYTQALLSAAPSPDPAARGQRILLTGEVPSPIHPPSGCAFHPRCRLSQDLARQADASQTVSLTISGQPTRLMRRCTQETPCLTAESCGGDRQTACFYGHETTASDLSR